MLVLNLGCGTRTSDRCVNIDWSMPLRLKASPVGRVIAPFAIRGERKTAYDRLDKHLMVHDLRKGIPFATGSVDVVYHSHVLEHVDRGAVPGFLNEIRRVLRPGGSHRIVVPDLQRLVREYIADFDAILEGTSSADGHDAYVARFAEQMVRREAAGSSRQPALRRRIENTVLGDARKRGETHQWMWDCVNLQVVLREAGFEHISVVDFQTSRVPDWLAFGLDQNRDGSEYKPGSLYMECTR